MTARALLVASLLTVMSASSAWAENASDKFISCLRESGNKTVPYNLRDQFGAIGSYRFSVNSLYDAGVCRGQAPYYVSYDWTLCDFKGPPAIYNRISSADDILQQADFQDKLVEQLVVKQSDINKDLLLNGAFSSLQRFQNAADLFGALLYRKGVTSLKLLALARINSQDGLGYTTRDYINFYADCAGNNTQTSTRRLTFASDTKTAAQREAMRNDAQTISWTKLSEMPADLKDKMLVKVPELRLVMGPREKHVYASMTLGEERTRSFLVALTGPDFCNGLQCTYYLFRNNFGNVITFYAGQVMIAPGRNGFYVNGFYTPVEELNK